MEPILDENQCVTRIQVCETLFTWTIENFSLCRKSEGEKLESPEFSAPCENQCKWNLELYPFGDSKEASGYVSIFIGCTTSQETVLAQYKISFEDRKRKCLGSLKSKICTFTLIEDIIGFPEFIKRDEVLPFLEDDALIIKCWVKWEEGDVVESFDEPIASIAADLSGQLSFDLHRLMGNASHSDFTLVASDGVEFPVHKCLLAVRSPVFGAMFDAEMKESREARAEIDDLGSLELKAMLEFVYANSFYADTCDMEELLAAADKYQLDGLKQLCELELCKKLDIRNVAELLLLADRHSACLLKTRTLNFIAARLRDVLATDALENLRDTRPCLFEDILKKVVNRS